jgi:hypothetical protein
LRECAVRLQVPTLHWSLNKFWSLFDCSPVLLFLLWGTNPDLEKVIGDRMVKNNEVCRYFVEIKPIPSTSH